jgi:uncharacterized protein YbaR (Trm112 family)
VSEKEWHRLMRICPEGHESGPLSLLKSNNWTEWLRRQQFDEHRVVCKQCGRSYLEAECTYRLLPEEK